MKKLCLQAKSLYLFLYLCAFQKHHTMNYKISKGLDLKLAGEPIDKEVNVPLATIFYVKPTDFRWLTPRLLVTEGTTVEVGTPLFADKQDERIVIVSPVKGTIHQIVRGEKRAIQAVVIKTDETPVTTREVTFDEPCDSVSLRTILLQNGLWSCLRQRPFSTIPSPDITPTAVFVSCFDSSPLAPNYNILLRGKEEAFRKGLDILRKAADNAPMHLCMRENGNNKLFESCENTSKHYFCGPHPAGNVGTQIHYASTINKGDVVWFVHPVEVARIGQLFLNHILSFDKKVARTGPCLTQTGYFDTVYGADISDTLFANLPDKSFRNISGNVLTGAALTDFPTVRFHDYQTTVIEEGGKREFIGWLLPGFKKWSFSHTFLSWLRPKHTYTHNTSLHGGRRTFMITDVYDKVFPFDIIPLSLLKACYIKDLEQMEALGIYEVDDEDFALCEVVCPSKMECQQIVREALYKLRIDN